MLESLAPWLQGLLASDSGTAVAVFGVVSAVVALASTIAALTPTPKDDEWVGKAYKVVDWLALNVFKAKDKSEDK